VGCHILARSLLLAYAYGPPYYDVYGDYGYYGGHARARHARARYVDRKTTGATVNGTELAQTCGGLAPGVIDLPIDRLEKTIRLTDEQLKALDTLKVASSQASDVLKTSCASEVPLTPLGRLDTVQKRLDGMTQAMGIVRTPLDNFYNSLNEEQRQRFAALAPVASARTKRLGSASSNDLAALCSRREESFTQLPVQRIEQVIMPTQQQQDAFDKLKAASTEAANQLQASCPAELPQAPIDRFDAVGKRLDAMTGAVKTVRPALADFYSSFNR
jgi:LTXXQ motif family protein